MPDLTVAELTPEETQRYNIIGVPEIAAEDLDTWTVGELAEIVEMVRSIADVCDLEVVTEVLDSAPAFGLLHQGTLPFAGREGARLWNQLVETIAERWDDVIDAIDDMIDTPEVDTAALAAAEKEAAVLENTDDEAADDLSVADTAADDEDDPEEEDGAAAFWKDVGIDPIRITTDAGDGVTLRCFIDGKPVFLGSDNRIELFKTERALTRWIATDGEEGHDLAAASTWPEVVARAGSELTVTVEDMNTYVLTELAEDLAEGPTDGRPRAAGAGHGAAAGRRRVGGRRRAARGARRGRSRSGGWCPHRQAGPDAARAEPAVRRGVGGAARAAGRAGGAAQPALSGACGAITGTERSLRSDHPALSAA